MKRNRLIGCGVVCVLGLGLCVGLAVALVGGLFALTKPVVELSEQFLARIGTGKIGEAYASAGDDLRAQQDEASFTAAVKQLGLTDFASVSWHNRQIENRNGLAEGTVTTRRGGTKPVSVRLAREDGRWAVTGMSYGGAELTTAARPAVPSDEELERLTAETLLDFNRAVKTRDFTAFHEKLADVWKKEVTPEQLQTAFHQFLDQDVDIGPIRGVKPRLARPAAVNENGTIIVSGQYPIQPSPVRFGLEFAREGGAWKLSRIKVSVG